MFSVHPHSFHQLLGLRSGGAAASVGWGHVRQALRAHTNSVYTDEQLDLIVESLDTNHDGFITVDELQNMSVSRCLYSGTNAVPASTVPFGSAGMCQQRAAAPLTVLGALLPTGSTKRPSFASQLWRCSEARIFVYALRVLHL